MFIYDCSTLDGVVSLIIKFNQRGREVTVHNLLYSLARIFVFLFGVVILLGGYVSIWFSAEQFKYDGQNYLTEIPKNLHVIIYGILLLIPFKFFIQYKIYYGVLVGFCIAIIFILRSLIVCFLTGMDAANIIFDLCYLLFALLALLLLIKENFLNHSQVNSVGSPESNMKQ